MDTVKMKINVKYEGHLHIFNVFLGPLLVNEVRQGSWYIEVLRSLFTDLFIDEIYNWRDFKSNDCYGKGRWRDQESDKHVLHDGRGFIALGLMKILGINGVLLLSTFSLNFS